MRVAIVVPVHNGARTLAACLGALVAEARPGMEIVVVDDASTDTSAAIAEQFPVRVVRRATRGGASAARNAGVAAAADADVIVLVDADVVVCSGALGPLLAPLADPELLGVNGVFDLAVTTPGLVTAFTNTSIHYQHHRHGARVASAFTGLCALRRVTLDQMGGWDERTSRYADDVSSRWHLPAGSIAFAPDARGVHLKRISLAGLLRHRQAVGRHFVRSVADNWGRARQYPGSVLLGSRYPANTAIAAFSLLLIPFASATPTVLLAPTLLFISANLPFALFTLRHRGALEALVAIPISALEGYAYGLGLAVGTLSLLRRSHVRAPTAAR